MFNNILLSPLHAAQWYIWGVRVRSIHCSVSHHTSLCLRACYSSALAPSPGIACIHHHQYQNHQTTPQSNLSAKSNLGSRNELLLRGFYCSTVVFWKETFLSMWMLRFISDKLDLLPELDLGLSGNKQRSNWNHVGNVSPLQGRCRDPIYICRVQDIKKYDLEFI